MLLKNKATSVFNKILEDTPAKPQLSLEWRYNIMGTDNKEFNSIVYNEFQVHRYLRTLPIWRRILARYFEKYKVTKEEYDKWFFGEIQHYASKQHQEETTTKAPAFLVHK